MKTNSISYASDFLIHLQKDSLSNINLSDPSNKNEIIKIIESEINISFSAIKIKEREKIKILCINFFNNENNTSEDVQDTIIEITKILDS